MANWALRREKLQLRGETTLLIKPEAIARCYSESSGERGT